MKLKSIKTIESTFLFCLLLPNIESKAQGVKSKPISNADIKNAIMFLFL